MMFSPDLAEHAVATDKRGTHNIFRYKIILTLSRTLRVLFIKIFFKHDSQCDTTLRSYKGGHEISVHTGNVSFYIRCFL